MATTIHSTHQSSFAGLGTYTYTVPAAGLFKAKVLAQLIPSTGISLVINQNGSPIATSTAAGASEILGAEVQLVLAAADVITWVVSSSTPTDYLLGKLLSTVSIALVASGS